MLTAERNELYDQDADKLKNQEAVEADVALQPTVLEAAWKVKDTHTAVKFETQEQLAAKGAELY